MLDGEWHHLAWAGWEDEEGDFASALFIDGVEQSTVADVPSDSLGTPGDPGLTVMMVGWSTPGTFFTGLIDDLQVNDTALDASEVDEVMGGDGGGGGDPEGPNLSLIVEGATFAEEGGDITMTANEDMIAGGSLVWYKDGGIIPGETNATFAIVSAEIDDSGSYTLWFDDGEEKATVISNAVVVSIFPGGSLPVLGLIALGLLVSVGAIGGAAALRKRQ